MSVAMQLILEVERDFQELKKDYTLFLNDVVKIEPYELKEEVKKKIKRLRNISNLRTEEQFRTNNLVSKVQSHLQLWERQLERKYTGRGLKKPKPKPPEEKPQPQQEKAPPNKTVVISNAASQREQVVELYDEYMRLNLLMGGRKMINFAKFQSFINNQTQKIKQAKKVEKVRYEITIQDQKVVIKSRSLRKKT
ncbi:MAG: MXAN_5187 C-terminal domain-containing protein [Acidobacteriota bacterium]|nr:MXAN_5187 C-terminal domain-containing protein [Acidobacteriota bacterium]